MYNQLKNRNFKKMKKTFSRNQIIIKVICNLSFALSDQSWLKSRQSVGPELKGTTTNVSQSQQDRSAPRAQEVSSDRKKNTAAIGLVGRAALCLDALRGPYGPLN